MASTTPPVNHSMAGRDEREENEERGKGGREREKQGRGREDVSFCQMGTTS